VLAAGNAAYLARLTRTTMIGTLREEFIRAARAKGISRRRLVYYHALRPSLLPVSVSPPTQMLPAASQTTSIHSASWLTVS